MIDESWSETTEFILTCVMVIVVLISIQFYENLADGWMSLKTAVIDLFGKTIQKTAVKAYTFGKKIQFSVTDDKSTWKIAEFEVFAMAASGPYSPFLNSCLRNSLQLLTTNEDHFIKEESLMAEKFRRMTNDQIKLVNEVTREGGCHTNFVYLILDPSITKNFPAYRSNLDMTTMFSMFLSSILYIGKGTRSRPVQHLYPAYRSFQAGLPGTDAKMERIIELWQMGLGPIIHQCFHNRMGNEAFTIESLLIRAIGVQNLLQRKLGDEYGESSSWSSSRKEKLGTYMLFNAFRMFLIEGEIKILSSDMKNETKREKV